MNARKVNNLLSLIASKMDSIRSPANPACMKRDGEGSKRPKLRKTYKVIFVALSLVVLNTLFVFDEMLTPEQDKRSLEDLAIMDEMDPMADQELDPYLQSLVDSEASAEEVIQAVRRMQFEQGNPLQNLRILSLGYTNAKINGRKAIGSSYTDLLESVAGNVVRAAGELTGPLYAATCTQSMIEEAVGPGGDQRFDVIILNYYGRGLNGLLDLAVRLRRRYPDTLFVVLEVRYLHHIQWIRSGTQHVMGTLQDFAQRRNIEYDTPKFFNAVNNRLWNFKWRGFEERKELLEKMRFDLRPAVKMRGLNYNDDVRKSLKKYGHFYSEDYHGLTKEGHFRLFNAITNAVKVHLQTDHYRRNPRLGTWGQGDECFSWYTSGNIESQPGLRYKRNGLQMEEFETKEGQLYALSTDSHYGWGWIAVRNKFDSPRSLCISYMSSGIASMYPTTEVLLSCEGQRQKRFVIQPTTTRSWHFISTDKLAMISPGQCTISWKAMEMADRPFRITAVKILPRTANPGGVLGPKADFNFDPY